MNFENEGRRRFRVTRVMLIATLILISMLGGWLAGVGEGKARANATIVTLDLDLKREREGHRKLMLRHQALVERQRRTEYRNALLRGRLNKQRALVRRTTSSINKRIERAIWRNGASGMAGNVPVVGDAADAAATAFDIWEYRQMAQELKSLGANL